MYTHVRSALEIKRKQLEMNRKTAELKRAFYEFYLAKNGDSPDAMQTARHLISAAAEFAACVQNRIDDGCRRDALFRVNARRNAASIVDDTDDILRQNLHINAVAVAG